MRIAFISDIHEDLTSLTEALMLINKMGCNQIICLGDICGFSVPHYTYLDERNASACAELIREYCQLTVAGNHDLFALRKTPTYSPLFSYPDNWYQLPFEERKQLSQGKLWLNENNELSALLTKQAHAYLNCLPEQSTLAVSSSCKLLLSHYIAPNLTGSLSGFYYNAYEFNAHLQLMKEHDCTLSITGHTHEPGLTVMKNKQLISIPYLQSFPLSSVDWVGVPPISRNQYMPGFAILDSVTQTITAVPIRKKRRQWLRF